MTCSHPLSNQSRTVLYKYQQILSLRNEDVAPIQKRLGAVFTPLHGRQDFFKKVLGIIAAFLLAGSVGAIVWRNLPKSPDPSNRSASLGTTQGSPTNSPPVDVDAYISAGDNESLIGSRSQSNVNFKYKDKQIEGIKAFSKGDYRGAQKVFKEIIDTYRSDATNKNAGYYDPRIDAELLIFLNNATARINADNIRPIYTIAAAVPLSLSSDEKNPFPTGQQMLLGIAQAQAKAISNNINLEVVIANDLNSEDQGLALARQLSQESVTDSDQNRKILAVIGNYRSGVTCAVLPTYSEAQLALISPTSTRTKIREDCNDINKVFFRTASSSKIEVTALADYLNGKIPSIASSKIAIFYNLKEKFSADLTSRFEEYLKDRYSVSNENLVKFELLDSSSVQDGITRLNKNEFSALAVFPDGYAKSNDTVKQAMKVIENHGNIPVVGSNPLYSFDVAKQPSAQGVVVAIDWFPTCSPNPDFVEQWTRKYGGPPNRISALSYEAVQVIADLLNNGNTTRRTVLSALQNQQKDRIKSDIGVFVDKKISFNGEGNRNEIEQRILITPAQDQNKNEGFEPISGQSICPLPSATKN
jgi:ABC-type branched-subunit amino acid transport system substrate-binding protein